MDLLVAWLAFPLLFGALTLGSGMLVERAAGYRLPGPLVFGVGFMLIVGVSQGVTRVSALAPLAPFAVLVVALAGGWLGRARVGGIDRVAVGLGIVVFAAFAAPSVLTGNATLLGYGNQGDAGFHLLLIDRILGHGYSLSDLPPVGSYGETVGGYFASAYPTGAHTALGAVRGLLGADVIWLLQPYLVLLVTLVALSLYTIVRPYARSARLSAVAAGCAVGAGLVYSYANNQQALKECGALVCIVTAVGVLPPLLATRPSWRTALPVAVVVGGGLGVLSLALAPWIGPILLFALAARVWRHRATPKPLGLEIAAFAGASVVLGITALTRTGQFVSSTTDALTTQDFGNLLRPLQFEQAFGVWPADDFRAPLPAGLDVAPMLIGVVAVLALIGFVAAIRRGAWPVVLFAVVSLVGFLYLAGRASPWAYGKALMILSPVAPLLAAFACIAFWEAGRRVEGTLLLAILAASLVWTDALTYHGSSAAPHDRLSELADIGHRFAGQGPLVYIDYEELNKHLLREADPTGVAEAYRRPGGTDPEGGFLPLGYSYDPDQLSPAGLLDNFKLLLTRPGPEASRPSTGWARMWHGTYYDVWRRVAGVPAPLAHLALGNRFDAASNAPCPAVRRIARTARAAGGRIAWTPRPAVTAFRTGEHPPAGWPPFPGDRQLLIQNGQGRSNGTITTADGGFQVWVEGQFYRPATVTVDDHVVGTVSDEFSLRPASLRVGTVHLAAGTHTVAVTVGGGSLAPGNGGINRSLGPVSLVPAATAAAADADPGDEPVRTTDPSNWRSLCGVHADWVEAVR